VAGRRGRDGVSFCTAEQCGGGGAAQSSAEVALAWRSGSAGGRGCWFKERTGILGERATVGRPREDHGIDESNAKETDREQRLGVIRLRW